MTWETSAKVLTLALIFVCTVCVGRVLHFVLALHMHVCSSSNGMCGGCKAHCGVLLLPLVEWLMVHALNLPF